MSERSPTPWEVSDAAFWRIYDANGAEVVNAEGVVSEELSDRIVRAVNLHGEMVEALREAEIYLKWVASSVCEADQNRRCARTVCIQVGCLSKKRKLVSSALAKATTTEG